MHTLTHSHTCTHTHTHTHTHRRRSIPGDVPFSVCSFRGQFSDTAVVLYNENINSKPVKRGLEFIINKNTGQPC